MRDNAITAAYLAELQRRGVGWDEVWQAAQAAANLGPTTYYGRCLTRPTFLGRAEQDQLARDLGHVHDALSALPERLYAGDLGAFARAAGMTDAQVAAILRGHRAAPTRLTRADLYHDGTEFRLMELNIGGALGGLDNAVLNRGMLSHPAVAEFVADAGLGYVDTMAELADMLLSGHETDDGHPPLFAVVDAPENFPSLEKLYQAFADALSGFGVEMVPCHLGQLDIGGGRVRLGGRIVDVIYRFFLVEDLLVPESLALIDPLLRAVERGDVAMFTPMDVELYGSKAALAMLSDEANRDRFTPAELDALDRILPWTRMVRDEQVTVGGERTDLLPYAAEHRADLVLKPTLLHGGFGVVLGWQASPEEWAATLRAAVDGPYVLQARIRPDSEPFPAAGGLEQQVVAWLVFTSDRGFGGAIVRASTDLTGSVLNSHGGATCGCVFTEA
ncbi:MAG: hypothetical protein ACJ74O_03530 [Frankiaceae bacterium]